MRILTQFARAGLTLAEPVVTVDGLPLLGRGTVLSHRHLRALYRAGVRAIQVVDDPDLSPWESVPTPDAFLRALEARFEPVAGDRRMAALKDAVRDVYLEFVASLSEVADRG
jgi:hypothetical protein